MPSIQWFELIIIGFYKFFFCFNSAKPLHSKYPMINIQFELIVKLTLYLLNKKNVQGIPVSHGFSSQGFAPHGFLEPQK